MSDSIPNSDSSASGLRVADLIVSGSDQSSAIDRGYGIFECQGIGNSYLITTSAGNVLVNTGTLRDARRNKEIFQEVSSASIEYIVLTQSHANQYGGIELYKTATNKVIAQSVYPEDRIYFKALDEHYRRGSRRVFSNITGDSQDLVPTREIPPDILFDQRYVIELGGRTFELISTPGGEARSALVVWMPEDKVVIVGNLFGPLFGNQPNLNTLRGDKPRSAREFVRSVRLVRDLGAEVLLTGHEVICGRSHIESSIDKISGSVQWIHDQTIQGMNRGMTLSELMQDIVPPPDLTLTEEYGRVSWNVRAIWHEYSGWFDPSRGITELYSVRASSIAPTLVELLGGTEPLLKAASSFIAQGKPLEAIHLLDIASAGTDASESVCAKRKEALELLLRLMDNKNLWERMLIRSEISALETGVNSVDGHRET